MNLQPLYLQQNIWFLIWSLKKTNLLYLVFIKDIMKAPFSIKIEYFSNGMCKKMISLKTNNTIHGFSREWYDTGLLRRESFWKNGEKCNIHKSWYYNGLLCTETHWKNNILNGIQRHWFDNGQLKSKIYWKNEMKNGTEKQWFPNGRLKTEIDWTGWVKNGRENHWYANGQIKLKARWKYGIRQLDWMI